MQPTYVPLAAPVIAYATPDLAIRGERLLLVAQWMALVPMFAGVACLIGFVFTRWIGFAIAGYFTIIGGCALFAAGLICVTVYYFLNRFPESDLRKQINREVTKMTLLLLANFPLAFVCAMIGIALIR